MAVEVGLLEEVEEVVAIMGVLLELVAAVQPQVLLLLVYKSLLQMTH